MPILTIYFLQHAGQDETQQTNKYMHPDLLTGSVIQWIIEPRAFKLSPEQKGMNHLPAQFFQLDGVHFCKKFIDSYIMQQEFMFQNAKRSTQVYGFDFSNTL